MHYASGRRVDAHLVLDGTALDAVGGADLAVVAREEFRHDEQADALGTLGRIRQARKHQVDDILGQVVFAGADEDLGAGDRIDPSPSGSALVRRMRGRCRSGLQSGTWFQTTRRRPSSQVPLLQLIRGMGLDGRDGALGQPEYIFQAMLPDTSISLNASEKPPGRPCPPIADRRSS